MKKVKEKALRVRLANIIQPSIRWLFEQFLNGVRDGDEEFLV